MRDTTMTIEERMKEFERLRDSNSRLSSIICHILTYEIDELINDNDIREYEHDTLLRLVLDRLTDKVSWFKDELHPKTMELFVSSIPLATKRFIRGEVSYEYKHDNRNLISEIGAILNDVTRVYLPRYLDTEYPEAEEYFRLKRLVQLGYVPPAVLW